MLDKKIEMVDEHIWFCNISSLENGIVTFIINTHERFWDFKFISPTKFKLCGREFEFDKFLDENIPVVPAICLAKHQIVIKYIPAEFFKNGTVVEEIPGERGYTITKYSEELISLKFNTNFQKYHVLNDEMYLLGKDIDDEYTLEECLEIPAFLPKNKNFYVQHQVAQKNELHFLFVSSSLMMEPPKEIPA